VLSAVIVAPTHRLAAEMGAQQADGPGSLRVGLLDALHKLAEGATSAEGQQRLACGLKVKQLQADS
jgi:hydroxyethylthiazole kinase-like sugar kinase family protein